MSATNEGGPAFPTTATATTVSKREDGASVLTNYGSSPGMTLRDYFAAAALNVQAHQFVDPYKDRELLAQDCYDIADAMLKAREAK